MDGPRPVDCRPYRRFWHLCFQAGSRKGVHLSPHPPPTPHPSNPHCGDPPCTRSEREVLLQPCAFSLAEQRPLLISSPRRRLNKSRSSLSRPKRSTSPLPPRLVAQKPSPSPILSPSPLTTTPSSSTPSPAPYQPRSARRSSRLRFTTSSSLSSTPSYRPSEALSYVAFFCLYALKLMRLVAERLHLQSPP